MRTRKIHLEIPEKAWKHINKLAKKEGRSKVEIIRRSLGVYGYLQEEATIKDNIVAICDKNGKVLKTIKWI